MKIKSKIKYEIIIAPEDSQHCGKCTYRTKALRQGYGFTLQEYSCLLFHRILDSEKQKPTRCFECKMMIANFEKMPELEEC